MIRMALPLPPSCTAGSRPARICRRTAASDWSSRRITSRMVSSRRWSVVVIAYVYRRAGFAFVTRGERRRGGTVMDEEKPFQRGNDLIAAAAAKLDTRGVVPFVCECADLGCFGTFNLTLEQFESRRRLGEPVIGPNCRQLGGSGS